MGRIIAGAYVALIIIFAIYGNWWGDYAYKGFAYNFGRSLFWPAIVFPSLGKVLGGLVILGVIGLLTLRKS